uniref:SH2 domain-containing protein n=1 Tax=Tetranychus urticae TaxID=32264 RepID=T1JS71_TETUR
MTSNSPAYSTLSWDTTSNHRSSHQHDSDSWKTDNQSNLTAKTSSNGNDSFSTVYTYGPIDGNLYATVSKPNKSSVSPNKPTQTHQYHLNSSNEQLPPSSSQQTGDMSYNESHIRSSIDSGISSVNSIGNSRPMTSVSTFLSPSTNMNGKTSILRQSSETNNNTVMPNGYKSDSVVNVEAIIHHKPESIVEKHRPANPSENYCNGKSSNGNFSSFTSNTISGISEAEQAALDELLSGMLKEVENFPDYPMHSPSLKRSTDNQPIHDYNNKVNSSIANNYNKNISLENNEYVKSTGKPESPSIDAVDSFTNSDETGTDEPVRVASPQLPPLTDHFGKIEPLPARFLTKAPPTSGEDERGRPYHARPGSQPFSYGVTATSPALQRRRVVSETTAYICESRPKPDTIVSTSVPASNDTTQPVSPLPETTPDSTINSLDESSVSIEEQVISNGHHKYHLIDDEDTSGLTWLQKQQLKLKNKHESKDLRGKDLVLAELKGTIARHENVSSMVDRTPDSRSSSPQHRFNTVTSSSPISRSPLVLPNLTASPIPRSPQPVQSSTNYHSSPPTPSTPPTPAPSEPPLTQSIVSNQATTMMSSLNLNDKSRQSPSLASSPTSVTYSRPLHVSTFEPRTSIGSNIGTPSNIDSPSTPNLSAGGKPPLNAMTRQNSIPSTPPHRYVSASGSVSPLTYSQIRDSYGRTPSSPEPGRDSPSVYFGQSQRSSMLSLNESDIISQHPTFIKDTSRFWYKPKIPREDAIKILLDKPPGTFIIRDSNSFPGAFGLALKVAQPPPDVQTKSGDTSHELVRHFLIEPTSKGVRIKGCPNEPVFASLSALVYQHSITPLALSCKLIIPDSDLTLSRGPSESLLTSGGMIGTLSRISGVTEAADILAQGAACNVLYLLTVETESLTGPLAVRNAVTELISRTNLNEIIVNFKVSNSGITLTDNSHRNFFRRHYPLSTVSHFGLDPEGRCYKPKTPNTRTSQLFGFVARARGINKPSNNECHLFVEFDEDQAASAIVNFANKVILSVNRDDRHK